jgi:hypothetical protein
LYDSSKLRDGGFIFFKRKDIDWYTERDVRKLRKLYHK